MADKLSNDNQPDLIEEVETLLTKPLSSSDRHTLAIPLLRCLKDEVIRLRGRSGDAVIQKIEIMQEKYPGQRIEISIEPDGYCHVTRSDGRGNIQPIAEGATMGDVFDD